jgi:hypothetical protein
MNSESMGGGSTGGPRVRGFAGKRRAHPGEKGSGSSLSGQCEEINILTRITESPESHRETIMYLIELQLNTRMKSLENPRLARNVGWASATGVDSVHAVTAVEGNRSPSPGGIREGLGANVHSWGVRRGLDESGGHLAERTQLPESRGDFVLQGAGGEMLMSHECPEIWRGKAENGKQKVEIGGRNPGNSGSWVEARLGRD